MPNSTSIGPYMGISDPNNFKNPKFCKLIHPLGANPSINIHEIYKFHQIFRRPRAQKLWVRSEKVGGAKMGWTSSMRSQSLVTIGGRTATWDEKQCCFLFVCFYVCMFVTLDVQERGPDVQQPIMKPFVEQFQCIFHCFSQKETSFSTVCRDFNYIIKWHHNVRRNRQKFWKFFKNWRKSLWARLWLFGGSI